MSKRKELLDQILSEDKNKLSSATTISADDKFIKREIRTLTDAVEDAEEKLIMRLAQNVPIDKSVIELLYCNLNIAKDNLKSYQDFKKEYLGGN